MDASPSRKLMVQTRAALTPMIVVMQQRSSCVTSWTDRVEVLEQLLVAGQDALWVRRNVRGALPASPSSPREPTRTWVTLKKRLNFV